jgi:GT2 family glycosyltransferase
VDVSVVIVSWNTRDLLRQCLRSVFEYLPPVRYEVFVVDNASTDGSGEMVQAEFPAVTLIQNNSNAGFARANNQALRRTCGRYMVLLNPDAQVLPGTVSSCLKFMDSARDVAVVGGELHNPDGSLQVGYFELPVASSQVLESIVHPAAYYAWWKESYQRYPPARDADWVSGSFMVVRREAAEEVGLLDERFFIFGEETEWCTRLRKAGWRVVYLSDAKVIHHHHQSTKQAPMELQAHALKGRQVLYWTHYPGPAAALITLHAFGAGVLAILRGVSQLLRNQLNARNSLRLGYRILAYSLAAMLDRKPRVPRLIPGEVQTL